MFLAGVGLGHGVHTGRVLAGVGLGHGVLAGGGALAGVGHGHGVHAEQGVELCEGELPPGEKRDSAGAVSQRLEGFCPRFSLLPERGIYPRTCLLQRPTWYLVLGQPTLAGP